MPGATFHRCEATLKFLKMCLEFFLTWDDHSSLSSSSGCRALLSSRGVLFMTPTSLLRTLGVLPTAGCCYNSPSRAWI